MVKSYNEIHNTIMYLFSSANNDCVFLQKPIKHIYGKPTYMRIMPVEIVFVKIEFLLASILLEYHSKII